MELEGAALGALFVVFPDGEEEVPGFDAPEPDAGAADEGAADGLSG